VTQQLAGIEELMMTTEIVRAMSDVLGEGKNACKRALERCNGDALLACGFLTVSSQPVAYKGDNYQAWFDGRVQESARTFAWDNNQIIRVDPLATLR
jgi:translation elongation factor EF-Ts